MSFQWMPFLRMAFAGLIQKFDHVYDANVFPNSFPQFSRSRQYICIWRAGGVSEQLGAASLDEPAHSDLIGREIAFAHVSSHLFKGVVEFAGHLLEE